MLVAVGLSAAGWPWNLLLAIRRAGGQIVLSYFALDVARLLAS